MFTALYKVLDFFWTTEEEEQEETLSNSVEEKSKSGHNNDHQKDQENSTAFNTESLNTKYIDGVVTHLFDTHGLIDNDVYFSFENVSYEKIPKIGDKVNASVKRKHVYSGWYAVQVTMETDQQWECQDEDELIKDSVVGIINYFEDGEGVINSAIRFKLDGLIDNYSPRVGDYVTTDVNNEKDCVWGSNIKPLRTLEKEATVTSVLKGHGYIEEDIFFAFDSCQEGYRPRRWDNVKVIAIESDQGKSTWRALSVWPAKSNQIPRLKVEPVSSKGQGFTRYRASNDRNTEDWIVPSERPRRKFGKKKSKLPLYPVPNDIRNFVVEGGDPVELFPFLEEELKAENYGNRFRVLLYLEEIQKELEMQEFDMERVCLRPFNEFLALNVPGVAEGRPPLIVGDKVRLTDPVHPGSLAYEGSVEDIIGADVLLRFIKVFHDNYTGKDYNVQFMLNRTPIRRSHHAIEIASNRKDNILFPRKLLPKNPLYVYQLTSSEQGDAFPLFNKQSDTLEQMDLQFINQNLNDRQKSAVCRIFQGCGRPLPYILFGPPGTGKTITLVEIILQVFSKLSHSRILVCAPSNSAADLITLRLHQSGMVKVSDMIRLYAASKSKEDVLEAIHPYFIYGSDLDLEIHYRIIVCTCTSAGTLNTVDIREGHFTHVFVDEAGYATEPECMVPLNFASKNEGQVVLSGDPMQLGPVIMSKWARHYGLCQSYLERLTQQPLYQRNEDTFADHGCYDPLLVTKLVDNFRSHEAILSLSSRLFYDNELQFMADKKLTHSLCGWNMLPRKDFPVIFHGVKGQDLREGDNPSWFNASEALQVVKYVQGLLKATEFNINSDDIGIITPYRKQVEKIRLLIKKFGMDEIRVGSVEEFQGQQRKVIIISTVRANERLIGHDKRLTLGFLSNPKRFNVAISRAQALLIVIGNPFVLSTDEYWRVLIQYCIEHGAYRGCEYVDDPDSEPDGNIGTSNGMSDNERDSKEESIKEKNID
ncbi:hypothetical protein FSP39_012227 [Pinctada imbricata]|uniref:RNA helicase n=1 Tax=Pinctada imbricata TaxID=66713 RepID=A0AA88YNX7_PINIB|nr:hypothetical protein FSP39_012227 [Pinctada imbricata]